MSCDPEGMGGARGHWDRIRLKAHRRRIPLFGGMELTNRCNLRCVHCYINTAALRANPRPEMSAGRIHRLVDEMAEAGCMFFTLTGGEPLLHPEFANIYRHLKESGIETYIFTNGTMIRPEHVRLFRDLPPFAIQFSLYGATAATYDEATGTTGWFDRCMEGLRMLVEARLPVTLALPVTTISRHEIAAMRHLAGQLGISAKTNAQLHATTDGDAGPCKLRLEPEEAIALEAEDCKTVEEWQITASRPAEESRNPDLALECAAGFSAFHVAADGKMGPCARVGAADYWGDLNQARFAEIWNGPVRKAIDCRKPENSSCNRCPVRKYCKYCGACCMAEDGTCLETPTDAYICRFAQAKSQWMANNGVENG